MTSRLPEPKPIFTPGSAVEVSPDEPGFQGSFYLGTVISHHSSSSDSYLVEYKTLVTESSHPLREEVGFSQLRPPPPPEAKWVFGMGDEVDVFHNDGWWQAVVTADFGNGSFEVFFAGYKEQMEFPKKKMRLHRDWVGGIWVPQVEEDEQEQVCLFIYVLYIYISIIFQFSCYGVFSIPVLFFSENHFVLFELVEF